MARLIAALIRHGDYQQLPDAPSAHQPWPLNSTGETQSREGAQALHDMITRNDWALVPAIDSSRMLRAWQTAVIFANGLAGLTASTPQIESYDALAERGVGCLANRSPSMPNPSAGTITGAVPSGGGVAMTGLASARIRIEAKADALKNGARI